MNRRLRHAVLLLGIPGALLITAFVIRHEAPVAAQDQGPTTRPFVVIARKYRFDPPRIEVNQDDLVRVQLSTDDIAHSMTIDDYRIAKRVSPGQPVTFEFRADKPGTFPNYCNLPIDERCRQMRGELIVKPRKSRRRLLASFSL